jgi:murein DD-endopeptidase MepM/ murein hydrolase activator NlpD
MNNKRMLAFIFIFALLAVMIAAVPAASAQATCGNSTVHTVRAGETLFRIARRYGSDVPTVAAANGLSNPNRIYVGQQLRIPCPGTSPLVPGGTTGSPSPAPVTAAQLLQPGETLTVPDNLSCASFRATSPLDGLANGSNRFYWNPAPGATSYRVNIYNLQFGGFRTASYTTDGFNTNLEGDVGIGAAGPGFLFAWEVEALVSDQVACRTPRQVMFREALPPAPPPAP